jgi:hypothetical protein
MPFNALYFLFMWGVWLSQNNRLFVDKEVPTFQLFSRVVVIFSFVRKDHSPNMY